MAETLGSLIDKLSIIKLKQWHCEDNNKMENLLLQEKQLQNEIDIFVEDALSGDIPLERLVFKANKVYNKDKFHQSSDLMFSLGQIMSNLSKINCELWHEQEKVYDFENVPVNEKNNVVNSIAILNLQRNQCIDNIDQNFQLKVSEKITKNN